MELYTADNERRELEMETKRIQLLLGRPPIHILTNKHATHHRLNIWNLYNNWKFCHIVRGWEFYEFLCCFLREPRRSKLSYHNRQRQIASALFSSYLFTLNSTRVCFHSKIHKFLWWYRHHRRRTTHLMCFFTAACLTADVLSCAMIWSLTWVYGLDLNVWRVFPFCLELFQGERSRWWKSCGWLHLKLPKPRNCNQLNIIVLSLSLSSSSPRPSCHRMSSSIISFRKNSQRLRIIIYIFFSLPLLRWTCSWVNFFLLIFYFVFIIIIAHIYVAHSQFLIPLHEISWFSGAQEWMCIH